MIVVAVVDSHDISQWCLHPSAARRSGFLPGRGKIYNARAKVAADRETCSPIDA
jgi:hypothetical protein